MGYDRETLKREVGLRIEDIAKKRGGGKSIWQARREGLTKVGGKLINDTFDYREANNGVNSGILVLEECRIPETAGGYYVFGVRGGFHDEEVYRYCFFVDNSWAKYKSARRLWPSSDDITDEELFDVLRMIDQKLGEFHEDARALEQFLGDMAARSRRGLHAVLRPS